MTRGAEQGAEHGAEYRAEIGADRTSLAPRLARARRALAVTWAIRALLLATAVVLGTVALGIGLDALFDLPLRLRSLALPLALGAGLLVLVAHGAAHLRRVVRATDEELALWFEARLPELRYALVTRVEPGIVDAGAEGVHPARGALDEAVRRAPLESTVARARRAALLRPAVLSTLLAALALTVPGGAIARVAAPRAGDLLARPGNVSRAVADPLATIVVRLLAPAYAGTPAQVLDDPATVTALAGSRVFVEGLGAGVRVVAGSDTLRAETQGGVAGGWRLTLPVPSRTTAIRLLGPARERLLVIDPHADSVPVAQLEQPARDSVLRSATGEVSLAATLRDDLGLAAAAFEFIVSAGAGETFTFRTGRVAARTFAAGVRSARIEGSLRLDTLKLGPGDLIHLRAVATDRNDVTGPGTGASETRTLRIARADEYDSVSVDPMPPTEPEKNALSQRMILQMTQALHAREPRIGAGELQAEARTIAREQTRLRKRVGEVVFLRLGEGAGEHSHFAGDGHEHGEEGPLDAAGILAAAERAANAGAERMLEVETDETPVVAINRPLLEAYNHMWRAASELEIAKPGAAIPWMERAIEALQRARAAERIYLRGRPARVVVDLAKVRGTGKDRGTPTARAPRVPLDAERGARLARFDRALDLVSVDASAAADSILLLRITLPEHEGAAARSLDRAADALRRGGDVTPALQGARRALAGSPVRSGALLPWGG